MVATSHAAIVLYAEDDDEDRLLVESAFRRSDLEVDLRFVADGEQLIDYLHRRGDYATPEAAPRPELILLDLNMPRLDGRSALVEIKKSPDLRTIPVIVLSTSTSPLDIGDAYDQGANSYVTKPSAFQDLKDVVQAIERYWMRVAQLPLATDLIDPSRHS
ncbi:MAG: response regulator [Candidatus Poribacteria bacterium]|nr:response regulator [Candidatus Poribacteria bacterium]